MKPQLRLAYLDETQDWDAEIVRAAGRIAGLYVYDARLRVHGCEITASYELYLAGALTEHRVNDAMQLQMLQATEIGCVAYVHCWQVDGFRRARRRPGFAISTPSYRAVCPARWRCPAPFPPTAIMP